MSRNVPSLQELLKSKGSNEHLETPKFLLKKERQKLALEKREAKVKQQHTQSHLKPKQEEENAVQPGKRLLTREEEVESNYSKILERSRGGKKFKFGWKDEEDTLNGDDALYSYDEVPKSARNDLGFNKKDNYLHWSQKDLTDMQPRDWRILKEDFEIITKGTSLPNPLRSWRESQIPDVLIQAIDKLGFKEPTPIQRASIPIALSKKDIIGIAETGSGKTLAFLIPMLSKILKLNRLDEFTKPDGPYGLILVPTRELAQQIESELLKLLNYLPFEFEIISLVGGKLIAKDVLDLQNKAIEIIIATPGRLIDCLENHYVTLNQVQFLVLDECDKMIEMNFGDQVAKITEFITTSRRQNMLFTATMTNDVENLSRQYVNDHAVVNIGTAVSKEVLINERINLLFEFVNTNEDSKKIKRLEKLLHSNRYKPPIIIFVNYKESGDFLNQQLNKSGFKTTLIHGSKSQDVRELAIKNLKDGKVDILIGTNVASRGIDINNVSLVVNYQMTKKIDDFVHRVGRTGRAGNYGTSITFLNEVDDSEVLPDLKRILVKSGKKIPEELRKVNDSVRNII